MERYYRAVITEEGETSRLELEPTIPSLGRKPLRVTNDTAQRQTVEIRVERHRDSEIVIDDTLSIPPETTDQTQPFDRTFGTYRVDVRTSQITDHIEWEERELQFPMDELVLTSEDVTHVPRAVLEPLPCQELWDRAYEE